MKNWIGPITLLAAVTLYISSSGLPSHRKQVDDDSPPIQDGPPGGASSFTGNQTQQNDRSQPPEMPPNPEDGSIPPGYSESQVGTAHVDYDGSGPAVNDPDRQWTTSMTINGQALDGTKVAFVVQNRNADGSYTYPVGTRVYAYNQTTGKGSWGMIGDNGPTNSGRNEMSPLMADNLGVTIRDNNGNYVNSTSGDQITYYYYPN